MSWHSCMLRIKVSGDQLFRYIGLVLPSDPVVQQKTLKTLIVEHALLHLQFKSILIETLSGELEYAKANFIFLSVMKLQHFMHITCSV